MMLLCLGRRATKTVLQKRSIGVVLERELGLKDFWVDRYEEAACNWS